MRVVVVGASGTIGSAVARALESRHEVVRVSHSREEIRVDLSVPGSIQKMLAAVGPFDALVSTAGLSKFAPLDALTHEDLLLGIMNKFMGQANLVRLGLAHAADGGSFTLTSGALAREPIPGSAAASSVNAAVEAFARAAALEMPRGIQINVVSPPWVSETLAGMGRDPAGGVPAAKVAKAYVEAVEGRKNGEVIDARQFA